MKTSEMLRGKETAVKRNKARLIVYGALTLCVMGAIFFFSSQPAADSDAVSEGLLATALGRFLERLLPKLSDQGANHDIRKYAHMTEFFGLGLTGGMFFSELTNSRKRRALTAAVVTWLFCTFYACTDELHQIFVEGRACRATDVGIDAIGFTAAILLVTAVYALIRRAKAVKEHKHIIKRVNIQG